MKRLEILLLAILGGFTAVFLFLTKDYNPTAALFPRIIAVVSLLFLIGGLRDGGRSRESQRDLPPSLNPLPVLLLQAGYVEIGRAHV